MTDGKSGYVSTLRCTVGPQKQQKWQKQPKIYPPVVLIQEYAPLDVKHDNIVHVGKSGYVPVVKVLSRTPKNGKKA